MIEIAVLLAVVAAALVAMQIYLKRGLAGRVRTATDSIGDQYAPRQTTSTSTLSTSSDVTTSALTLNEPEMLNSPLCNGNCQCADLNGDGDCTDTRVFGTATQSLLNNERTNRTSQEQVQALNTDVWQP